TRASLTQLSADAVALARVTAPDPFSGLPDASDLARAVPELSLYDRAVGEVSADQATEWCKAAEAAALQADPRITNSEGAEFDGGSHLVVYAASNGFQGSFRSSSCSLAVVPTGSQNGPMGGDNWRACNGGPAGAREIGPGGVSGVFDPDMAGSLLRHLAGAVSGNALYKGMSFLTGKLGETIAPAFVNVLDDGRIPGGLGSKPFDGEGLPTRRTPVIEGGVLRNYLFDTYSARKMKSRSTGNAGRSVGDSPHVSATNLV